MHDQCAQSVALDTASLPDQSVVQYRRPDTLRHTARDAPVIRMDLLAGPTIAKEVLGREVAGRIAHEQQTRIPTLRIIGHYVPNFDRRAEFPTCRRLEFRRHEHRDRLELDNRIGNICDRVLQIIEKRRIRMDYAVDRPLHKNSLMLLGFFRQPIRRYALRGQGGTRAEERLLPTASRKRRRDTIALSVKGLTEHTAGCDWPKRLHPVAAITDIPVVKVHRWVTMARD